jgi:hypothetical protein
MCPPGWHLWSLLSLHILLSWVQLPRLQPLPLVFQSFSPPVQPGQCPVASFFSIFSRFLLTAVALLSSYSIHLLLKSSGIVGEPPASLQRGV